MARLTNYLLLPGLAAARPAAATVPSGLYYSTDTKVLERSNGTTWDKFAPAPTDVTKAAIEAVLTGVISSHSHAGGAGSGVVLLESHVAAASASLDFTTRNAAGQSGATFQADYDDYLLEVVNLLPATNAADIYWRASTNGGSSYDAGANYTWQGARVRSNTQGLSGSASDTFVALSGAISTDNTAAEGGLSLTARMTAPLSAVAYKRIFGQGVAFDAAVLSMFTFAGYYKSATAVNAFRVIASAGNLTSGVVRLYGMTP